MKPNGSATESEYTNAQKMAHTSSLPKPNPWSVEAVLSGMPSKSSAAFVENTTSPIPFFHFLERLKIEKREGWRRFGIRQGESISDHMYRMSLITMFAPPTLAKRLDIARCTKMALIHDMAEGLVGDLTPVDGVPKPEKSRREATTIDWVASSLLGKVHGGTPGQQMKEIWQEYEDGETEESKFVHDVDKIELLLQMVEYEREADCDLDLSEFTRVATRVKLPEMHDWAVEILDERKKMWDEHEKAPRVDSEAAKGIEKAHDEYYGTEKNNLIVGEQHDMVNGNA